MREQLIQSKIIKFLEQEWWFTIKTIKVSPNWTPDVIAFRWGNHLFIEVKTEIGVTSKLQEYVIKKLRENGSDVIVNKGYEDFIIKYEELCINV